MIATPWRRFTTYVRQYESHYTGLRSDHLRWPKCLNIQHCIIFTNETSPLLYAEHTPYTTS